MHERSKHYAAVALVWPQVKSIKRDKETEIMKKEREEEEAEAEENTKTKKIAKAMAGYKRRHPKV
jgi:hypothetical protein